MIYHGKIDKSTSMNMNYNDMSDEELLALYNKAKNDVTKYNLLQMAAKIAINSAYGACGNAYFRYYSLANAEAVTKTGQVIIRWAERKFNEYLQEVMGDKKDRVVAIDTDSCYVSFQDFVDKYMPNMTDDKITELLDQFAEKKLQPLINGWTAELATYMNHVEDVMYMKREAIARTGFFIAKKRYALSVTDLEGYRYPEPELKIMGLETQRSSTPRFASDGLKTAIELILGGTQDQLQKHFTSIQDQYMTIDYREISGVSSANNLEKYSTKDMQPLKGCPGHIKGVLAYNRVASKLEGVDTIREGEKVAIIMLTLPNRYMSQSFAYPSGTKIPDEMNASQVLAHIDRHSMFEKAFVKPLDNICSAIGWKYKDAVSLEDFFM